MSLAGAISGVAYATDVPAAVAAIDAFEAELLIYGAGAAVIFDAPRADPELAAGHALAAAAHLFTMSPAGAARARTVLAEADAQLSRASPRERLLVAAIRAWAEDRLDTALDLHLEIAARWPRDLLSAKIAVFHQLNRGDFAGMVRLTARLVDANPDRPATLGMHAFALEQTGAAAAAEAAGRTAAAAGFDPWAQHAVAHVMDSAGRHAEGAAWMDSFAPGWARCSSFLRTHNWWHLALFRLDLDDWAGALALYDAHVWGVRKDYAQDQVNAVSLLARLELRGIDVGARWQDVADFLEPRTGEHINAFLDLHYLYGLARAGRDRAVAAMLASLDARARSADEPVWRTVAPMAARALAAHARGRHDLAAELLGRLAGRMTCVGGSHTQRDLFDLVHLDSLVRTGAPAAGPVLARRVAERGESGWLRRLQASLVIAPEAAMG
jgi:hypothetical protein